jgi:hypothetical protein
MADSAEKRAVRDGIDEGLRDAAEFFIEAMQRNMPVGDPAQDPNPAVALADQIYIVEDPDSATIEIQIRTPYAAKQNLDRRLSHPRGGDAQFAEDALIEILPRLAGIVAGPVRANLAAKGDRR